MITQEWIVMNNSRQVQVLVWVVLDLTLSEMHFGAFLEEARENNKAEVMEIAVIILRTYLRNLSNFFL